MSFIKGAYGRLLNLLNIGSLTIQLGLVFGWLVELDGHFQPRDLMKKVKVGQDYRF